MSPSQFSNVMGAIEGAEGGAAGNEMLFQANIQDNTQEFFNKFDANVKKIDNTAATGFNNVAASTGKSNTALAALAGVVAGVTQFFVGMAVGAVQEFATMLGQAYQVTEAYDKLAASMYIVGQNAGYNHKQMDTFIADMKAADMSSMGAVQVITKMAQAQLDLSKSGELAKVAADASAISNQSQETTMNSLVRSIQVLSPRLLRNMGIYVDMTKEIKKYADAHNISTRAVDNATKQQLMLNAVLEQGKNIQGAYAAMMKTAAGQEMERAHIIDEINLAIGRLLQPALYEVLKSTNGLLEDLLKWLTDNEDGITRLANAFGVLVSGGMKALVGLLTSIFDISGKVLGTFRALGIALGDIKEPEGLKRTVSALEEWNRVSVAAIEAQALMAANQASNLAKLDGEIQILSLRWERFKAIVSGNFAEMKRTADLLSDVNLAKIRAEAAAKAQEAYNAKIWTGVENLEALNDTNNDVDAAAAKATLALKAEADAVDALNQNLENLQKKLEEDKATAAIKAQRQVIESELRDSWQREDMARNLADNIAQIEKNSQDQRVQLVTQYAEQRWNIEHQYKLALQRLEEQFNYASGEAARRRDAVGMLALVRKNKEDLKNMKEGKQQQEDDAKRNYNKIIKDQDEALQKQIKAVHESYNKQLVELQRSKDREKKIQALHDKWAQEDIERATNKQLQTFIDQYYGMEGATRAGLDGVLSEWNSYFIGLNKLIDANSAVVAAKMTNMLRPSDPAGHHIPYATPTNLGHQSYQNYNTGQAGLVTSMLTPSGMRTAALDTAPISRIPSVSPQSSRGGHRSIDVNVAGNALDPYIQRILVRSLLEIERNAA